MKFLRLQSALINIVLLLSITPLMAQDAVSTGKGLIINPGDPVLLDVTPHGYHAEWSPDGSCFAFAGATTGDVKMWIVPITGGPATEIVTGITGDCYISWKRDGSLLAFDSYPNSSSPSKIWTIRPDGSDIHMVTRYSRYGGGPTWSPDGTRIAFNLRGDPANDIFSCTPEGTGYQRITNHPAPDWHGDWSPDGLNLAFTSDRSGNADIWIKPLNGDPARQITFSPANDDRSCWSPDNHWLLFVSNRTGNDDIWVVNVEDGSEYQLTFDPGRDSMPTWSPNGDRILYTGELGFYIVELGYVTPVKETSFGSLRSQYLR